MPEQRAGVAILGLGNIGGAVARAIVSEGTDIALTSGVRLELVGGFARGAEYGERAGVGRAVVVTDAAALIDDPMVDVVVEVLGGEQPAADLMCRALAGGKHVVTA